MKVERMQHPPEYLYPGQGAEKIERNNRKTVLASAVSRDSEKRRGSHENADHGDEPDPHDPQSQPDDSYQTYESQGYDATRETGSSPHRGSEESKLNVVA